MPVNNVDNNRLSKSAMVALAMAVLLIATVSFLLSYAWNNNTVSAGGINIDSTSGSDDLVCSIDFHACSIKIVITDTATPDHIEIRAQYQNSTHSSVIVKLCGPGVPSSEPNCDADPGSGGGISGSCWGTFSDGSWPEGSAAWASASFAGCPEIVPGQQVWVVMEEMTGGGTLFWWGENSCNPACRFTNPWTATSWFGSAATTRDWLYRLHAAPPPPTPTPTGTPTPTPAPLSGITCTLEADDSSGSGTSAILSGGGDDNGQPRIRFAQTFLLNGELTIESIGLEISRIDGGLDPAFYRAEIWEATGTNETNLMPIFPYDITNRIATMTYPGGFQHLRGYPIAGLPESQLDDQTCEPPPMFNLEPAGGETGPEHREFTIANGPVVIAANQPWAIYLLKDNTVPLDNEFTQVLNWKFYGFNQFSPGDAWSINVGTESEWTKQPGEDFGFGFAGQCSGCQTPTPVPTPTVTPTPTATPTPTPTPTPIYQEVECLNANVNNENQYLLNFASGTHDHVLAQQFSFEREFDLAGVVLNLRDPFNNTATGDTFLALYDTAGGLPNVHLATATKDMNLIPNGFETISCDVITEVTNQAIYYSFTTPLRLQGETLYWWEFSSPILVSETDGAIQLGYTNTDTYDKGLRLISEDGALPVASRVYDGFPFSDWSFALIGTERGVIIENVDLVEGDIGDSITSALNLDTDEGQFLFAIGIMVIVAVIAAFAHVPSVLILNLVLTTFLAMVAKTYLEPFLVLVVVLLGLIIAIFKHGGSDE